MYNINILVFMSTQLEKITFNLTLWRRAPTRARVWRPPRPRCAAPGKQPRWAVSWAGAGVGVCAPRVRPEELFEPRRACISTVSVESRFPSADCVSFLSEITVLPAAPRGRSGCRSGDRRGTPSPGERLTLWPGPGCRGRREGTEVETQ